MKGWIKLHRKILNNPIADKPIGFRIWIECLMAASHNHHLIDYGGKELGLEPGQFVFGRLKWAKKLRMSPTTVHKWIKKLIARCMIREQVGEQGLSTIYQIEKWEKYQGGEQVREQDSVQVGVQVRNRLVYTTKNDKNDKNDKNVSIPTQKYSSLKDITDKELTDIAELYKLPLAFVKSKYEDLINYCERKGKSYKNYLAALRNFVKQDAIQIIKESKKGGDLYE